MAKVAYGNSYSALIGMTPKEEKAVRDALSYTVGDYFSKFTAKRSLLDKRGNFPTGVLGRVVDVIDIDSIDCSLPTPEMSSKPYVLPYSLRLSQDIAVKAAVKAGRGTIVMPTGTGKSAVISALCSEIGLKALVVVPNLEIKKQLANDLKKQLYVTVENIDSPSLQKQGDYDVLIIDEAHHAASKTYQKLNKKYWNNITYRFFLTATPFRSNKDETLLFEALAGEVIYTLSYDDAVASGAIVPVEAYYLEIPKQETDAYTYRQVYDELVVNNTPRNMAIAKLLDSLANNASTLCLVREIEHGQILSGLTGIPFVCGVDPDSREFLSAFSKGAVPALIGTTGVCGEGVNTKACEYVIIAGLGKAKGQFMQQVGRAVRTFLSKDSAKVILIKDKSHKFLTRHFNAQKAILKDEYGVVPVKLDLD